MSPLLEKRLPSLPDTCSPCARERIRISVEPKVPAEITTWRARTK
jgi:hypothetical protein